MHNITIFYQEERDREDEEEERRAQDDAAFFEKCPEDSEWLEYKDTNKFVAFYFDVLSPVIQAV